MKQKPSKDIMLKCEDITSLTENDALWNEWKSLLDRVRPEFRLFGPEWYHIWSKTWGAQGRWTGELRVLAVRDAEGVLQGVLGIGQPKIGPVRVHSFGGHDAPFRTIVAADGQEEAVGQAIGNFIASSGWNLFQVGPMLRSLPAEKALVNRLREQQIFLHRHRSEPQAICDVPETWEEYRQEVLGKKFFNKIGYYERRTERAGKMAIVHHRQPSVSQTAEMLDALAIIESRSWMMTRENAHPRFIGEVSQQMWSQLIEQTLSPNDQIDCWIMSLDGKPVSFCFTLTTVPVRYVLANNFDDTVRIHSTGSILYRYMIEDGIKRGVRRFDFGDGDIHYKRRWGAEYKDACDTLIALPNRLTGSLVQTGFGIRNSLKTLFRSKQKSSNAKEITPKESETQESDSSTRELVSVE